MNDKPQLTQEELAEIGKKLTAILRTIGEELDTHAPDAVFVAVACEKGAYSCMGNGSLLASLMLLREGLRQVTARLAEEQQAAKKAVQENLNLIPSALIKGS